MNEFEGFVEYFRKQRHDFMNELQVIYGYIQVGKDKEAKDYIEKMVNISKELSKIYSLGDNYFGILMEENFKNLLNDGVKLDLFIELEKLESDFKKEYHKKSKLVNNIFNEIGNNKYKFVHIYIFEDETGESILISNCESVVDELDWMEEWEEINSNISNVKLHKYMYGEDIGYRLTFI